MDKCIYVILHKMFYAHRYNVRSYLHLINSLSTSVVRPLITLASSLDPDQARRIVGPELGPNCLTF